MISEESKSARAVIEQLWYRARINAFAHKVAVREASRAAEGYFRREILGALGSILCIVLVYLMSTSESSTAQPWRMVFTFSSIALTLYSTFQSVMANYLHLNVKAADHSHLLNKYQYLAQRAREVKWPGLPTDEVVSLLRDLERDFQLLKATGTEPEDSHFDVAHAIVRKIRDDKDAHIAQSFDIGVGGRVVQHIRNPRDASSKTVSVGRGLQE